MVRWEHLCMNAEDDPERRIRELEQPLADTARASELGATQPAGDYPYAAGPAGPAGPSDPYASPWAAGPPMSPPPPLSYGGPFLGTSPRPPSGNRVWWILAAVIVVGVLAVVGGIAAFAAHQFSRVGSITVSPSPSISRSITPPSAALSTSPAPPPGGNLNVAGINENQTIACNDSIVSVSGVSNTVVITGHCASLSVSGVHNSITIDTVDTIEASGFNNNVTYHSGSPKVTKSGEGNLVQQG
jgi:hypothetical protein